MRNAMTGTGPGRRLSLVSEGSKGRGKPPSQPIPKASSVVDICEARSSADRESLQTFRHRVAIMDMNRARFQPDQQVHSRDDNLRTGGVQLIASCSSEIAGTIQINYAFARDLGVDADFYRMREFAGADHPRHTCIISRLLVAPAWRGGSLGRQLCIAAYRHALGENARTAFLRCNDSLIFYFSTLGFKPYMGKAQHAIFGEVLPMKLDLQDEQYLTMVHSPLVDALRAWKRARTPDVRVVTE